MGEERIRVGVFTLRILCRWERRKGKGEMRYCGNRVKKDVS